MKLSIDGLIALIGHEAIVLSRYKDIKGIWTIGVGHTSAAGGINPETFLGTMTMAEVLDLLHKDVAAYEAAVAAAVTVPLLQHEFDALVSFHYNTGAIATATLTATLNSGNRQLAGEQFLNWMKPVQIRPRRLAESALFLEGIYPPPMATVFPADADGNVLWGEGMCVDVRALLADHASAGPREQAS